MTFEQLSYKTARECGSYRAIAEMMAESIRDLDSDSEWTRDWAKTRLVSLAQQLEETVENYKKEVDTVA